MTQALSKRLNSIPNHLSKIPLWVYPLLVSLLLFCPVEEISPAVDGVWYISSGLNIYKGLGYVDTAWEPVINRGPIYPFLIAVSFWLFGISVINAFWVTRIFYVLNGGIL